MRVIARLRPLLQIAFLLLVTVFIVQYLSGQWDQIRQEAVTVNWRVFAVAQIVMTLGMALFPVCAWLSLYYLGEKRPRTQLAYQYFLAGVAKYLPGSLWTLPGRVFLYQRAGVPALKGTAALIWEIGIMVVSAFAVGLLSLRLILQRVPVTVLVAVALLGVLVFAVAFVFRHKLPLPERVSEFLTRRDIWLTPLQAVTIFMLFVLSWIIIGAAFIGMVYAVSPGSDFSYAVELIGVFSGAWVIGFLFIPAPSGIGVRDVLIGIGLAGLTTTPQALVVTILSRIGWTAAEAISILLSSAVYHWLRRMEETPASANE